MCIAIAPDSRTLYVVDNGKIAADTPRLPWGQGCTGRTRSNRDNYGSRECTIDPKPAAYDRLAEMYGASVAITTEAPYIYSILPIMKQYFSEMGREWQTLER
jgi:hypothetical protein